MTDVEWILYVEKHKKYTNAQLKRQVQRLFNEYIRIRDAGKPCITCGQMRPLQCGHFLAVKEFDVFRFDEDNAHGECAACNGFSESHLIFYLRNLENKIGKKRVNKLITHAKAFKRNRWVLSRSVILRLKIYYKEKLKEIKNNE